MNLEEINTLIRKLEAAGHEKVKENLRHNRYSSRKLTYIDKWLEKQEEQTWLYHETEQPEGKIFKRYEVPALQKKGWVDTPDKFGKSLRSRARKAKNTTVKAAKPIGKTIYTIIVAVISGLIVVYIAFKLGWG